MVLIFFGVVISTIVILSVSSSSDNEDTPTETDQEVNPGDESVPNKSGSVDALTNRGNELYSQGEYDSALIYYNRVLAFDARNQYAMYDKALVYYAKKDYNRCVPILRACIRQYPDYGEALWLFGDVFYDRNNLDSAKICFDRAYATGLRTGSFLQLMASVYENENLSRAIELYKESIQQDSTLIESYRKLSMLEPSSAEEYSNAMKRLGN